MPHVRHGIGTCEPTGAKVPKLEGPGQKSPSHKALEHWDAPVRNQRAKPLVRGAKMLGFSFWHSHVWHGLARGRSARVGCECYVRNLVFFRSKMPDWWHGMPPCETSVPNHSWEGRKCSVSVFGTRTCGTVWHGADRHGLVVSVKSVT
jgi:hypothetical protein